MNKLISKAKLELLHSIPPETQDRHFSRAKVASLVAAATVMVMTTGCATDCLTAPKISVGPEAAQRGEATKGFDFSNPASAIRSSVSGIAQRAANSIKNPDIKATGFMKKLLGKRDASPKSPQQEDPIQLSLREPRSMLSARGVGWPTADAAIREAKLKGIDPALLMAIDTAFTTSTARRPSMASVAASLAPIYKQCGGDAVCTLAGARAHGRTDGASVTEDDLRYISRVVSIYERFSGSPVRIRSAHESLDSMREILKTAEEKPVAQKAGCAGVSCGPRPS